MPLDVEEVARAQVPVTIRLKQDRTCLYARVDGQWGCVTIKSSASASIAGAEAWLIQRDWEDWG